MRRIGNLEHFSIESVHLGANTFHTVQGVRKVLGLFNISQTNATGALNIHQQVKTMAGDDKPDLTADCSLDVTFVGGDDGLDTEAEALTRLDDVGV